MENLTFNDVYVKYINYLSLYLKPTTLLNTKRIFNKHILSIIGNLNIYTFSDNDFINWQSYLKNKGFSNSHTSNIQIIFKRFFDYIENFYGVKNITRKYGYFKTFEPKKEFNNVWSMKEYRKFIKKVDDPIYHALFNLLFFTGCRKGEALALRFSDLQKYYIFINKTISKDLINNKHIETTPKTKNSIRKIRIDKKLFFELKKLQKYYINIFQNFNDNFYLFGGIKPISCTTLKRKKDDYCKIANVKQIRIHDFRHSHATILYHHNINTKAIQYRLGHADQATTIDRYVHLTEQDEKKVLKTLNFLHFHF